jgi:hypothetical protein
VHAHARASLTRARGAAGRQLAAIGVQLAAAALAASLATAALLGGGGGGASAPVVPRALALPAALAPLAKALANVDREVSAHVHSDLCSGIAPKPPPAALLGRQPPPLCALAATRPLRARALADTDAWRRGAAAADRWGAAPWPEWFRKLESECARAGVPVASIAPIDALYQVLPPPPRRARSRLAGAPRASMPRDAGCGARAARAGRVESRQAVGGRSGG